MKKPIRNTLALGLLAAMLAATPAMAQPRHMRVPSQETLAEIPGLTQAQRDAIYRIETEKQAEQKALWETERSAHLAIRDKAVQELRTAIGDEAYATYAAWQLEQRAEHRNSRHQRGGGRGGPTNASDGPADPEMED